MPPLPKKQGGLGNSTGDASGLSVTATGASASQTLGGWLSSLLFGTPTVTSLRTFNRLLVAAGTCMYVSGFAAQGDGGGGPFVWSATSTAADDGGTIINPTGNTGAGRWLRIHISPLNVKWFGAKGDNSTDDTAAIQATLAAAANRLQHVYVPPGTYLVSGLTYVSASYASMFSIFGDGRRLARIKQIATGASTPVLTIGSVTQTNYMYYINLRGITFDANDKSQPALVTYDLARSLIYDVLFTNGSVGYLSYGGIGNTIFADAIGNSIGAKVINWTSSTGGHWPNLIRWTGALASNDTYGLYLDGGRNFVCDTCDIEGNGTTLAAAQGGVYVGPNMGVEVGGATSSAGLTLRNCWFEGNFGEADVVLNSGRNLIDSCLFNSLATGVTYDIHIVGGNYTVLNSRSQFTKTANIKDESGVAAGNYLKGGYFAAPSLSKTSILEAFNLLNVSVSMNAGNGLQVAGGTFKSLVPAQFSVSSAVTAAGTTQATATALTADISVLTTVSAGSGVRLQALVGQVQQVINTTTNAVVIYPATNTAIGTNAANTGVTLAAGARASFTYATSTQAYQGP